MHDHNAYIPKKPRLTKLPTETSQKNAESVHSCPRPRKKPTEKRRERPAARATPVITRAWLANAL